MKEMLEEFLNYDKIRYGNLDEQNVLNAYLTKTVDFCV
mgnify:CR=1 FL=1